MFKKKCPSCAKKADKKFNYCPYCGGSFKASKEQDDFGLLGREDFVETQSNVVKLPLGMEKLMGSLVRQLEKELKELDRASEGNVKMPRGIRINISTGRPMNQVIRKEPERRVNFSDELSEEEMRRRMNLPKVSAESKVRRLSDKIIYEIIVPGVKVKEDVSIAKLATGLEIRAYSKDKCYIKFIPLTVEVIRYSVKDEKVLLELKA